MPAFKQRTEYTYFDNTAGVTTFQTCGGCATGCPWNFNETGGNTTYSTEYLAFQRTVDKACQSAAVTYFVVYDAFAIAANRFQVLADGVSLFNSGCITGSGSATFTIPANTVKLDVLVYGACNSLAGDLWSMSGTCT